MYLKYWYNDELNKYRELDERGSEWIYLTSREFERVFAYKERPVLLVMEHDKKGDSDSQKLREIECLNRMAEVWKNLKSIRRIRDVALPYRIVCDKEKFFYNKQKSEEPVMQLTLMQF